MALRPPGAAQQRPSAVRYRRLTVKIPLNSSLLPTIFVSVTVLFTRLVRISAAPSLPGDRSICSEKVKSFSAMWVRTMACCCSCFFSMHSSGPASASVQKHKGLR